MVLIFLKSVSEAGSHRSRLEPLGKCGSNVFMRMRKCMLWSLQYYTFGIDANFRNIVLRLFARILISSRRRELFHSAAVVCEILPC